MLKFDGFLSVYREDWDDEDINEEEQEGMLPPLTVGQEIQLKEMKATERFTRHPPRFTEASLVKKMEELGIGRPSTYAPTISTIQKRGYVEKRNKEGVQRVFRILQLKNEKIEHLKETENTGAEKSKLFPTDLGLIVTDFLKQYFDDIMDYNFTARIEEEFDEVAGGRMKWNVMIDDFYLPFKKDVEKTIETGERMRGERELGIDPETGKKVLARMGRYGPMVQLGAIDDEEKPKFAKVPHGESIETITFEEALNLFKLQGVMGQFQEKDIAVGIGKFGPYVRWGDEFISIPKGEDMSAVNLNRAIQLIEQKIIADAPVGMYDEKPITKGKGRFGPYIKWNGMFINVPRRYNFDALIKSEMDELIEAKIKKELNRYIQNWPEEKISIENARWGPVIKFNKKLVKLPKKADDTKYASDDFKEMPLEDVKKLIESVIPNAFGKKKAAKKSAPKK